MQLDKKKYLQKEAQAILDAYKAQYEIKINEQIALISQLKRQNEQLLNQLEKVKEKELLILSVLKRAEQTAMDLENQSKLEYELELERLKKFSADWDRYFARLKEKFPDSEEVDEAIRIKEHVDQPGKSYLPKQTIKELEKMIDEDTKIHPVFDPKKKIGSYIASTSDGGFNMDEVLYPGELELGEICKELGLMGEEE